MLKPKLSIVVVVYKMRRQAINTLFSLSAGYQRNVNANDYEVIVVENNSPDALGEDQVISLGPNFRYFLRQESRPTPVYALNFGVDEARAEHVCLVIDGARLATPRLVRYTLDLLKLSGTVIVATPGYHLGEQDQKFNLTADHNEDAEIALLKKIDWPHGGYRLFDIACFSASNTHGFLHPMMESNCITCSKDVFIGIGGAHEGFQTPGGGSVNLDIYRNLVLRRESKLFVLPGEGTFHQFHGGITTAQSDDLDAILAAHREEMAKIRGEFYSAAKREPSLYGAITGPAMRFLHLSAQAAQRRFNRFAQTAQNPWPDDFD
jgi:glycosyltransferase involved in cell wall biosynthesis